MIKSLVILFIYLILSLLRNHLIVIVLSQTLLSDNILCLTWEIWLLFVFSNHYFAFGFLLKLADTSFILFYDVWDFLNFVLFGRFLVAVFNQLCLESQLLVVSLLLQVQNGIKRLGFNFRDWESLVRLGVAEHKFFVHFLD